MAIPVKIGIREKIKIFLFYSILILSFLSGCSRVKSEGHLLLAGHQRGQAEMKKSCTTYLMAYYHDASSFKLKDIGRAADTCLRAQDYETAASFLRFQDRYRETHPGEALQPQAWINDQSRALKKMVEPQLPPPSSPSFSSSSSSSPLVRITGSKPHLSRGKR